MNQLVSVIIPCFRQAHFLAEAIDSVRCQTHTHYEIIVVNDGSDDHTDDVAAQYHNQIVYLKKPNGGLSSARNAGIAASTGTYLYFLDSDDALRSETLEMHLRYQEKNNADVSVCGYQFWEGQELTSSHVPSINDALWQFSTANIAPPHAYMCRKQVANKSMFDETLPTCEDWDYWHQLACSGAKFTSVPYIGALYRRYPNSMSTNSHKMLVGATMVTTNIQSRLLESNLLSESLGLELCRKWERLLIRWLAYGNQGEKQADMILVAMRTLQSLGIVHAKGWRSALVNRLFGANTPYLRNRYLRLFRPGIYQKILDSVD
jgi:glycosyltransferase involved in cell wall biosynthesis